MIKHLGAVYASVFIFWIVFYMIAVMNIVTSLFVDKAMKLAQPEAEIAMLEKERMNARDTEELLKMFYASGVISQEDRYIDLDEFRACMKNERFHLYFSSRDIDAKDTAMFFKM